MPALAMASRMTAAVEAHISRTSRSRWPGFGVSVSVLREATATSRPSRVKTAAFAIVSPLSMPSRYTAFPPQCIANPPLTSTVAPVM